MKRKIFAAMAVLAFSAFSMNAQTLKSTTWKAYGVSFKAPAGFNVEDDSEEGYIISTPTYYITVQLLEGEGIQPSELSQELKNIATDDEVTNQTPVTTFELPQFYGAQLKGNCETEQSEYSNLLTKDGSSGFNVSITKTDKKDNTHEAILKSYTLEQKNATIQRHYKKIRYNETTYTNLYFNSLVEHFVFIGHFIADGSSASNSSRLQ